MATLAVLRQDLFELVARNTELDPTTVPGREILDRYLQRGYEFLLGLKAPRVGKLSHAIGHLRDLLVLLEPLTGTVQSATSSTLQAESSLSMPGGLSDWLCVIKDGPGKDQVRIITQYNDTTKVLTVFPAWDTLPTTASTYLLTTKRLPVTVTTGRPFTLLFPEQPHRVQDVLAVWKTQSDGTTRMELSRARNLEEVSRIETGDPEYFAFQNSVMILDKAPVRSTLLNVTYRWLPAFPTSETEEVYLPVPYEQLLVLLARWWILIRYGEIQDAYAAKKDFYDFLATLAIPGDDTLSWTEAYTTRRF